MNLDHEVHCDCMEGMQSELARLETENAILRPIAEWAKGQPCEKPTNLPMIGLRTAVVNFNTKDCGLCGSCKAREYFGGKP